MLQAKLSIDVATQWACAELLQRWVCCITTTKSSVIIHHHKGTMTCVPLDYLEKGV